MKTKNKILSLLTLLSVLSPALASAQTANVPKYVNFQAVLRDDSGNLIEDGFIDLEFKILDQDGDEMYYEIQPGVQVVRSAVNVLIGEGVEPGSSPSAPTGGLPFDALNPAGGTKFLQMKVGSNLPSDNMELGSVPYAMFAQTALGLAPDIPSDQIPGNFVTEEELAAAIQAHENDTTAHPASSITVVGPIVHGGGTTVEQALVNLDGALTTEENARASGDNALSSAINTEESNRSNADNVLQGEINSINTTISDHDNRITALENNDPASSPVLNYPNDSSREYASGQTVGSSTSVIYSKTLDDNSSYILRATVVILDSTQVTCRNYTRDGLFRRNGAGAIEVSDDQTHAFGPGSARVEWQISGNSAQLLAVGASGETVNYNGWVESIKVVNP